MEILFVVSSVDMKLIQIVVVMCGDDFYDWVVGVLCQNNFGGLWDNYVVCGFVGDGNMFGIDYFVNGFLWNCGMSVLCDIVNFEWMEVFKGLVFVLYGCGDLGGIISYMIKQLQFVCVIIVGVLVGSYGVLWQIFDMIGFVM